MQTHNERWQLVLSGRYEVSDLGNIRRAVPGISTYVGRPCRPQIAAGGYQQVCLSGEVPVRHYVHRLVADAFCEKKEGANIVNHKDRRRDNNVAENLEWVTQKQNVEHGLAGGRKRYAPKKPKPAPRPKLAHWTSRMPDRIARAERMPHSKMTASDVVSARCRAAAGEKQSILAAEFGISVAQMSRIINGTRWKYV